MKKKVLIWSSIMVAVSTISVLAFNVGVYYYASENKKIWAHLAMNFGIVYATISLINYFIQLISIMPSVLAKNLEGLDIWVSGNSNSIFFALMASYFLMCISYFFTSLVFTNRRIRFCLQIGSVGCVVLFIIGGLTSISVVMLSGALCWIVGTAGGTCLIALEEKQSTL